MCCNNAYVSKNTEFLSPEEDTVQRVKRQERGSTKMEFPGEMHITDRKDND